MNILKFGGSSVANATNIKRVIEIIRDEHAHHDTTIVVVSALGGVTDALIAMTKHAAAGEDYSPALDHFRTQHLDAASELIPEGQRLEVHKFLEASFQELTETLRGVALLHLRAPSPELLDLTMSFGERLSAYLVSQALTSAGLSATSTDTRALIRTDAQHGSAAVDFKATNPLLRAYANANPGLSVLGGFIASRADGTTTTLGRGGSDYTAAIVGAALQAEEIQIWTDVSGVMTADPRIVPEAFPLAEISYEEAGELAHFGAKVIHPKTMQPAREKDIPILIKNTLEPSAPGTLIRHHVIQRNRLIEGISALNHVSLLSLKAEPGLAIAEVAAAVFQTLAHAKVEVLLTTHASAEQSLSIGIASRNAKEAEQLVKKKFELELAAGRIKSVEVQDNFAIISIVGKQMRGVPNISSRMFNTLGAALINVSAIAQGSSELNISAVIKATDQTKAVQALHRAFFQSDVTKVPLFLIGTGQIGSKLLDQIQALSKQQDPVRAENLLPHPAHPAHLPPLPALPHPPHLPSLPPVSSLPILPHLIISGITNSRHQLNNSNGLSLPDWREQLEQAEPANLESFLHQVKQTPDAILIDCSSSQAVADHYLELLKANVSVVAANKKANSGSFSVYQALQATVAARAERYRYGTNVGAGLPILQTLQNLVATGDEIIRIEGVFSGTLSYIFNTFSSTDIPFSQIVLDAKQKGYTEPDPRDDLSGLDVARKLLILARETGRQLELTDINISPTLDQALLDTPSVTAFIEALPSVDAKWEKKRQQLKAINKRFLPIASLTSAGAKLELTVIDSTHPFYSLSGSDNIVAFTTRRYQDQPLVIRGPGAGAEVTAAGVLGEVIQVLKSIKSLK